MLKVPVGTLTFLMTDIEGSTRLWEDYPAAMTTGIVRSEQIIHEVVTTHDGYHVIEQGEGDSTLSVFKDATQALRAAGEIREQLALEKWPDGLLIRVRIGLHSGVADMRQQTYYGRVVNRAARVRAVAHGGQIILTRATRELLDSAAPKLKDHGQHRLKDLLHPEHLFELPGSETFPPLSSLSNRPNNLPVQLTPFIGRTADLVKIQERLATSRMVTLVGAGGCGKTRLALQAAAEAVEHFADGAFFIDLTSARSADDIAGALLRETMADSIDSLKHREVLLVIDNCEHIASHAAKSLKRLLESTQKVRVLATSRQALHLRAESLYRVSPLSLPHKADLNDAEKVGESEAVQLFVSRAESKLSGFHLTPANCRPVGEICVRLDGIPLAIELAVPRLKLLPPEELLSRLDERFKLLKTADRTETRRHQTLLAAVRHSYDLLSPDERALFRCLAVFRSGWSLQAAEGVVPEALRGHILELLEALFDKSLIHVSEDDRRSYLLETIREFALLMLEESGESDGAFERMCRWYIVAAGELRDKIASGDAGAVGRLDQIMPNVEEALDWAIRASQPELGLELASVVWEHWNRRGNFSQARGKLRSLLGMEGSSDFNRARGSSILGALAWYQDDLDEAKSSFELSLALYEQLGERGKIAKAKSNLGLICVQSGNLSSARSYFQQALNESEEQGDQTGAFWAGSNLGALELESERPAEAAQVFLRLLPASESADNALQLAMLYCNLAECELADGDHHQAAEWLIKGARFFRDEVYPNIEGSNYCLLSALALSLGGKLAQAVTVAEYGKVIRRKSGVEFEGRARRLDASLAAGLATLGPAGRRQAERQVVTMDQLQASLFIESALNSVVNSESV